MKALVCTLTALLVFAAGCKKEKKKKEAEKPLSELIDTEEPGLVGPLKAIAWGASIEELEDKLDWIDTEERGHGDEDPVYEGVMPGFDPKPTVRFHVTKAHGLWRVVIPLAKEDSKDMLKKWGKPEEAKIEYDDVMVFHHAKMRAYLKPSYRDEVVHLVVEPKVRPNTKPFEDLVDSDDPGLVGPFSALKWGVDTAGLLAAAPWIEKTGNNMGSTVTHKGKLPGWETDLDVRFTLEGPRGLTKVEFSFPGDRLAVFKRWGAPIIVTPSYGKGDLKVYLGKNSRVVMKAGYPEGSFDVEIEEIQTYPELVKKDGAFAAKDVLGKTWEELAKSHPRFAKAGDEPGLSLPATPFEFSSGYVNTDVKEGRITGYTVTVGVGKHPAAKDQILAALEAEWGKALERQEFKKTIATFFDADNGVRVSAQRDDTSVSLQFTQYVSLEEIIGKKGEPWGFEKKGSLLGKSASEIVALFPGTKNAEHFIRVRLGKTDYDARYGDTDLSLRLKDGKVKNMSLDLEHGGSAEGKKRILDQLSAKFGPPKPAPKDWQKRQLYPTDPPVYIDADDDSDFTIQIGPN